MANIPISKINKEASAINNNDLLIISQPDSSVENGYVSAKVKWSTVKNNIDVNNIEYLSQSEYDSKKAAGTLDPTKYYATPVNGSMCPLIDWSTKQETQLYWDTRAVSSGGTNKTYVDNTTFTNYYVASRNEIVYINFGLFFNSTTDSSVSAYVIPNGTEESSKVEFYNIPIDHDNHTITTYTFLLNKGDKFYLYSEAVRSSNIYLYSFELNGFGGVGSGSGYGVGGGVIDGDRYLLNISGDYLYTTSEKTSSTTLENIYTVENDCGLMIRVNWIGDDKGNQFYLDNQTNLPLWEIMDNNGYTDQQGGHDKGYYSDIFLLKKGTQIYHRCCDTTSDKYTVTFIEYKLNSLNPQIAMPDWDTDKKIVIPNSNWTVPKNGYIIHDVTQGQAVNWTKINTIKVSGPLNHAGVNPDYCIPVSKGDVLEYELPSGYSGTPFVFYPCKSVVQDASSVIELLYPVGSIYFDGNNSNVCPLEAVISGSTWEAVGTKLLTDGSTAPVVGNGKALVLTDDNSDLGVFAYGGAYGVNLSSTLGDVGSPPTHNGSATNLLGVTTDATKSGLITDLSSATGLSVKIWKRIS